MTLFIDRVDAGRQLTDKLLAYEKARNAIVLALPRGGVPVAFEIAKTLQLPLDVFIVRKIGLPWYAELAMGAIASGDVIVLNQDVIQHANVSVQDIQIIVAKEQEELNRREKIYRKDRVFPSLKNTTVILVDDGVATGATMSAAITALKKHGCHKIIVAVPVAPIEIYEKLRSSVDELICLQMPEPFFAIGSWYLDFSQTSDDEVLQLLERAQQWQSTSK